MSSQAHKPRISYSALRGCESFSLRDIPVVVALLAPGSVHRHLRTKTYSKQRGCNVTWNLRSAGNSRPPARGTHKGGPVAK